MGVWNPRAFCPNCGAKIHTHKELGKQRTGNQCPFCGAGLTGKVSLDNKAVEGEPESVGPLWAIFVILFFAVLWLYAKVIDGGIIVFPAF